MAKIVLLTQWFPPEPDYLLLDLAIGLKERGHQVEVVTAFPNYPYGKIYEGYKQSLNFVEYMDDIKVTRLPVFPDQSKSIIKRGFSYLSFSFSMVTFGLYRIPKADIYLCYSPPLTVGLATYFIALIKRAPFIINIQDMWPDTLVASGMIQEGFITRFIDKVATFIYKKASAIIVLSEGFKEHLIGKSADGDKIYSISNWAYETSEEDRNNLNICDVRPNLGLTQNDFVIMFAGNLGPAQALETVIKAAELAPESSKVQYLFIGDGVSMNELQQNVKELKLSNVKFAGRVPHEDMHLYYSMSDALLIHLKKDDLFKITIPHKLLSYLEAGKPILSAVDGTVNNIVKAANAGLICNSENTQQLADQAETMSLMSYKQLENIGINSKKYFNDNFTKLVQINKWSSIINKIVE